METKKLFPLFLVLLLSCSEKDENPIIPVFTKPDCLPTVVTTGSIQSTFEYDPDRRIIKSYDGLTSYIKYEYSGDRLQKLTYYYDNDESKVLDIDEIQYNARGLWTKHVRAMSDEEDIAEYDPSGNRTKVTLNKNGKTYRSYIFEYANGNLIKLSKTYHNDDGSVSFTLFYSYEYDLSQENTLAYFELYVQRGYLIDRRLGQESTPSKNLLTKVHTHSSDGGPIERTGNFEYTFNAKGFPTNITVSGGDLNADGVTDENDIAHFNYIYNCI